MADLGRDASHALVFFQRLVLSSEHFSYLEVPKSKFPVADIVAHGTECVADNLTHEQVVVPSLTPRLLPAIAWALISVKII